MNKLKNFFLLILNILALTAILPIIEYDLSKSFMPDAGWLRSYPWVDLSLFSVASIVAIYNISLLFLVMIRRLFLSNQIIWITTVFVWALIGVVGLFLGNSFALILFPSIQ